MNKDKSEQDRLFCPRCKSEIRLVAAEIAEKDPVMYDIKPACNCHIADGNSAESFADYWPGVTSDGSHNDAGEKDRDSIFIKWWREEMEPLTEGSLEENNEA